MTEWRIASEGRRAGPLSDFEPAGHESKTFDQCLADAQRCMPARHRVHHFGLCSREIGSCLDRPEAEVETSVSRLGIDDRCGFLSGLHFVGTTLG